MTTTPVYNALDLLEASLRAALAGLVPSLNGAPAAYWQQAPDGTSGALKRGQIAHFLVFQSQDGGGRRADYISQAGWSGLVVIRAHSLLPATAATVQDGVPAALAAASIPAGYTIACRFDRPIAIPPLDGIHTRASQWRITITRA